MAHGEGVELSDVYNPKSARLQGTAMKPSAAICTTNLSVPRRDVFELTSEVGRDRGRDFARKVVRFLSVRSEAGN